MKYLRITQTVAVIAFLAFFAFEVWYVGDRIVRSMDNRERIAARCETSVHEYLDRLTFDTSGVLEPVATSTEATSTEVLSTEVYAPPLRAEQYP